MSQIEPSSPVPKFLLEQMWISASLRDEAKRAGMPIESDPEPLFFDTDGNLPATF